MSFEVFDSDAGGARNEHIGVVELPFSLISEVSPVRAVQGWFQLSNRPGYGTSKAASSRPQRMLDDEPVLGQHGEIFLRCELAPGQTFRGIDEKDAMERVTQWQRIATGSGCSCLPMTRSRAVAGWAGPGQAHALALFCNKARIHGSFDTGHKAPYAVSGLM